ncbi:hypothetical protein F5Y04DRAFT_254777 [Hypomontagnella monticulosa]|nr:hypothetical protein F5Y04DRAFT_254777 [Hypomontagnella monticulosa]
MGWMWSSSSSPSKGPNASEQNTPASAAKQAESEYSDPEIAKFMAQLQAEFGGNSKSTSQPTSESETKSTPPPPTPSQSSSSSWTRSLWGFSSSKPAPEPTPTPSSILTKSTPSQPTATPERLDPISESLLPSTMSCRQAFDNAFHCNSLGGQWTAVYREGTVRSCSEQWEDFWFCMRTRTYPSPQKEEAIRAHYRAKEWAKYHAPGRASSADVWEPRAEKVERDTAFRERMEMPDVSDEEWRRMEIERRRRVQEQESRRM